MNPFLHKLAIIISSLWVGGIWTMLMVTTILFNKVPSSYVAGAIASDMFTFMNLFGMFSSGFLLFYGFKKASLSFFKSITFWLIILMLSLIMISFFGINPLLENIRDSSVSKEIIESVFISRSGTWHGIASAAFLIECVLGIFLILKIR
jgi:hypothetical protein|tara:strand:+ start:4847 stop:5293 length:447 start_codon:yes stop_codon:yes gene_type:complete